jgi:hypothetical protein
MKTRKQKSIPVNVLTFVRDNHVLTAELKKSDEGWCAEWLVSTNFRPTITLVGSVTLPIHGDSEAEVSRRAEFMVDEILGFVLKNVGGSGVLTKGPDKDSMVQVGLAHIMAHRGICMIPSVTQQSGLEYLFLVHQIGYVAKPAHIMAELEGVKLTTMKRRIAHTIYGI